MNKQKHDLVKAKDRKRKQLKKQAILEQATGPTATTPTPFGSIQSFGKASAKAKRNLPKSPTKKKAIIKDLVWSLLPKSKTQVYNDARKSANVKSGRPKVSSEKRDMLITFLERPDISYCKPGRGDTVY